MKNKEWNSDFPFGPGDETDDPYGSLERAQKEVEAINDRISAGIEHIKAEIEKLRIDPSFNDEKTFNELIREVQHEENKSHIISGESYWYIISRLNPEIFCDVGIKKI